MRDISEGIGSGNDIRGIPAFEISLLLSYAKKRGRQMDFIAPGR
jgi:hypothetical protein